MAWMGHGVEMISIGAFALAFAFLVVIPAGNLLLLLFLPLPFLLSFPQGICCCFCSCCCLSCCHSRRESAVAVALALAFFVVIPEGNLLFPCVLRGWSGWSWPPVLRIRSPGILQQCPQPLPTRDHQKRRRVARKACGCPMLLHAMPRPLHAICCRQFFLFVSYCHSRTRPALKTRNPPSREESAGASAQSSRRRFAALRSSLPEQRPCRRSKFHPAEMPKMKFAEAIQNQLDVKLKFREI